MQRQQQLEELKENRDRDRRITDIFKMLDWGDTKDDTRKDIEERFRNVLIEFDDGDPEMDDEEQPWKHWTRMDGGVIYLVQTCQQAIERGTDDPDLVHEYLVERGYNSG